MLHFFSLRWQTPRHSGHGNPSVSLSLFPHRPLTVLVRLPHSSAMVSGMLSPLHRPFFPLFEEKGNFSQPTIPPKMTVPVKCFSCDPFFFFFFISLLYFPGLCVRIFATLKTPSPCFFCFSLSFHYFVPMGVAFLSLFSRSGPAVFSPD